MSIRYFFVKQTLVGQALARKVGLKPDLQPNGQSRFKSTFTKIHHRAYQKEAVLSNIHRQTQER